MMDKIKDSALEDIISAAEGSIGEDMKKPKGAMSVEIIAAKPADSEDMIGEITEMLTKAAEVDPENEVWRDHWKKTGSEVYNLPSFGAMTDAEIEAAIAEHNIK